MTFSCRRAAELISASMDRALTRRERFSLRVHLLICGMCRTYRRHLRVVRRLLHEQLDGGAVFDDVTTTSLSPEARQRIGRAIADGSGGGAGGHPP